MPGVDGVDGSQRRRVEDEDHVEHPQAPSSGAQGATAPRGPLRPEFLDAEVGRYADMVTIPVAPRVAAGAAPAPAPPAPSGFRRGEIVAPNSPRGHDQKDTETLFKSLEEKKKQLGTASDVQRVLLRHDIDELRAALERKGFYPPPPATVDPGCTADPHRDAAPTRPPGRELGPLTPQHQREIAARAKLEEEMRQRAKTFETIRSNPLAAAMLAPGFALGRSPATMAQAAGAAELTTGLMNGVSGVQTGRAAIAAVSAQKPEPTRPTGAPPPFQAQQVVLQNRSIREAQRAEEFFTSTRTPSAYWNATMKGFEPGSRVEVLARDTHVVRYFSASAPATARGRWLTEAPVDDPVRDLALPPENAAGGMKEWTIPAGTPVLRGVCAPLNGERGGGSQLFVADPSVLRER